jgi:hypothetical protein
VALHARLVATLRGESQVRLCFIHAMIRTWPLPSTIAFVAATRGVVFYAHGFGGHGQRQWELAQFFSSAGFPFFVLDHQGALSAYFSRFAKSFAQVVCFCRFMPPRAQALEEVREIAGTLRALTTTLMTMSSS